MSRRDALERNLAAAERQIEEAYRKGLLTPEQYDDEMRELQREAQHGAREAYAEDLADLNDEWRW